MYQRSEGHFKGSKDTELYFQRWSKTQSKMNLIITHGHGEHSGSYHRLVSALDDLNLNIYAWDLRGHGRSEGQRGFAESFEDYCKDFELFLKKLTLEKEIVGKPIVLLSHSMGGLIQMKTLCDHPQLPICAAIFSAPLFGLALPVPAIKDRAARFLNQLFPKLTLWNEIKNEDLSRDLDVIREFETDNLRHNKMSSGVYLGSLNTMSLVRAGCAKFNYPCLFQMSDTDPVTSFTDANTIFENLSSQDKSFKVYKNRKHELYNDLDRNEVFIDLKEFLRQHGEGI